MSNLALLKHLILARSASGKFLFTGCCPNVLACGRVTCRRDMNRGAGSGVVF